MADKLVKEFQKMCNEIKEQGAPDHIMSKINEFGHELESKYIGARLYSIQVEFDRLQNKIYDLTNKSDVRWQDHSIIMDRQNTIQESLTHLTHQIGLDPDDREFKITIEMIESEFDMMKSLIIDVGNELAKRWIGREKNKKIRDEALSLVDEFGHFINHLPIHQDVKEKFDSTYKIMKDNIFSLVEEEAERRGTFLARDHLIYYTIDKVHDMILLYISEMEVDKKPDDEAGPEL